MEAREECHVDGGHAEVAARDSGIEDGCGVRSRPHRSRQNRGAGRYPRVRWRRPFTSVLLGAWDPTQFGVFDENAGIAKWPRVVTPACTCDRRRLPTYFDHLRQIAGEASTATGAAWTPRQVDMALLNLLVPGGPDEIAV